MGGGGSGEGRPHLTAFEERRLGKEGLSKKEGELEEP